MFDRSRLPPLDPLLLMRTAEMLALPERVCLSRSCRRSKRCTWFFPATKQPCCIANLDAEQRALFDQLAEKVRDVRDYGGWESQLTFTSAWRGDREIQDAAVETARPLMRRAQLRQFRRFVAAREKQPPPEYDGFMPPLKW